MIDYQDLRDYIQDAIADDLGIYTFQDGSVVPAIILTYGTANSVPDNTAIDGLECVVVGRLEVPMQPLQGNQWAETFQVQVRLRQWDRTKSIVSGSFGDASAFDKAFDALSLYEGGVLQLAGNPIRLLPQSAIGVSSGLDIIEEAVMNFQKVAVRIPR